MFLRVKGIKGRRYVYLVEGTRDGRRVKQKVVRYLGPVSRVALGIPPELAKDGDGQRIDWRMVRDAAAKIPLTLEELTDARRQQYSRILSTRRQGFLTRGTRPRVEGEEDVLSKLAASSFKEKFVETGKNRYRMK